MRKSKINGKLSNEKAAKAGGSFSITENLIEKRKKEKKRVTLPHSKKSRT